MSIKRAKQVLKIEADAIRDLIKRIDENFSKATDLIAECKGRVVVTGMGKAGLIGQKISSTLSSLGTPSLWVHCVEAIHGDLGRITQEDVVIALSNSGETEEVTKLLPLIKKIGSRLIAITGNKKSTLAKHADVVLDVNVKKEACPFGLAPTSSTTCMLAIGDALAVSVVERKSFRREDFAFLHPGGSLGRKLLLKVEDIMRKGKANPVIKENTLVKDVLLAITQARAGAASVVDKNRKLVGIFTDGDLRRHLDSESVLVNLKVKDVMTKNPITIHPDCLAEEALKILKDKKIDELPVVDKNKRPVGMLDVQDLLKAGLV
jgi:arabinose-5-phosphate isomerase